MNTTGTAISVPVVFGVGSGVGSEVSDLCLQRELLLWRITSSTYRFDSKDAAQISLEVGATVYLPSSLRGLRTMRRLTIVI